MTNIHSLEHESKQVAKRQDEGESPRIIKGSERGYVKTSALFLDAARIAKCEIAQRNPEDRKSHLLGLLKKTGGFSMDACDILHVSARPNGDYAVVDGGGRLWMARYCRVPELPCIIYRFKGTLAEILEQEADLFLALAQNRKGLTAADLFSALVVHKNPMAKAIQDGLRQCGALERKKIKGIAHLLFLQHLNEAHPQRDILKRAITFVRATWNNKASDTFLSAIGAILYAYPGINEKRLREVCERYSAAQWASAAPQFLARTHTRRMSLAIAALIVNEYNSHLPRRGGIIGRDRLDITKLNEVSKRVNIPNEDAPDSPKIKDAWESTLPITDDFGRATIRDFLP